MAHYSNRQFFRQTPNHYLILYFNSKGIDVDTDITQLKENDIDALQGILNPLDDTLKASIEANFQGINALAREGGINALVDEAQFYGDDAFIEAIAAIDGFHAKAMWVFLNKLNYWRGASMFLHADNVSPSYWRKRNDLSPLAVTSRR